jgi:hypothetical protein
MPKRRLDADERAVESDLDDLCDRIARASAALTALLLCGPRLPRVREHIDALARLIGFLAERIREAEAHAMEH